jgi:hypothetical protein
VNVGPGDLFDDDEKLTTVQGAQAVNVSPHAVRKWRTRGYLDPQGERRWLPVVDTDAQGNPLHRYGDLRAAEIATHNSGRSHRRLGAPHELDTLPGTLRVIDWDALDRQNA